VRNRLIQTGSERVFKKIDRWKEEKGRKREKGKETRENRLTHSWRGIGKDRLLMGVREKERKGQRGREREVQRTREGKIMREGGTEWERQRGREKER
jgi:hypothetical protein